MAVAVSGLLLVQRCLIEIAGRAAGKQERQDKKGDHQTKSIHTGVSLKPPPIRNFFCICFLYNPKSAIENPQLRSQWTTIEVQRYTIITVDIGGAELVAVKRKMQRGVAYLLWLTFSLCAYAGNIFEVRILAPQRRSVNASGRQHNTIGHRNFVVETDRAALRAKGVLNSTIVPCCIRATACKASSSPRCCNPRLKTSYRLNVGTKRSAVARIEFAKKSALGPSAKYSSHPEESTTFTDGPSRDRWMYRSL